MCLLELDEFKEQVNYPEILYLASEKEHPHLDDKNENALVIDQNHSLNFGKNFAKLFATGSCASYPGFVDGKKRYRTKDVKYNIENAFYAAMSMADKAIRFNQIPTTWLTIGETEVYFIGE